MTVCPPTLDLFIFNNIFTESDEEQHHDDSECEIGQEILTHVFAMQKEHARRPFFIYKYSRKNSDHADEDEDTIRNRDNFRVDECDRENEHQQNLNKNFDSACFDATDRVADTSVHINFSIS